MQIDWTWIITILAIIGTIANIKRKAWCFWIWLVTNSIWIIVDYRAGLYAQAFLFCVYFSLSIWGLWEWQGSQVK